MTVEAQKHDVADPSNSSTSSVPVPLAILLILSAISGILGIFTSLRLLASGILLDDLPLVLWVTMVASIIGSLTISPMLAVAGVAGWTRKKWAHTLLTYGLIASALFSVCEFIAEILISLCFVVGLEELRSQGFPFLGGGSFVLILALVATLQFAISLSFYVWGIFYLRAENVKQIFCK